MPYWCTKFEGNQLTRRLFFGSNLVFKSVQRRSMKKISEMYISQTTKPIFFKLGIKIVYMEGYVNLIEISPVVIEIQGVENGNLVVPVNNTIVCLTSFLNC